MMEQEDETIVYAHAPNVRALNFIKQTLLDVQRQRATRIIIVGEFNILL